MTIEKLEEITNEYLQGMQAKVMTQTYDKMNEDLQIEYKQMVQEFINLYPSILEKYRDEFELDPMEVEIDVSSEDIVNKIYERVVTIKRRLEQDEEIEKLEESEKKEVKEQPREGTFSRKVVIQDKLREMFHKVEIQMKKQEFNINWDSLKGYCNRIINKYTETIEKNVFEKNEDNTIIQEIEQYVENVKQEMMQEKSEDIRLEFKDGPVCPIVTDTNAFSKVNQQIADDVQKQKEQNEQTKENELPSLPVNFLE